MSMIDIKKGRSSVSRRIKRFSEPPSMMVSLEKRKHRAQLPYAGWCVRCTSSFNDGGAIYTIVCRIFPFVTDCFGLPPCVGQTYSLASFGLCVCIDRLGNLYGCLLDIYRTFHLVIGHLLDASTFIKVFGCF